jgi:hypothetical protein
MSSVPGPIIRFLIDSPGLSSAVQPAMQQVRDQARATTQAIASDWQRMSAQIRASLLNEVSTTKQIGVARRELVGVLDRELAMLRSKDVLTTKELSTLKAVTLERERQADAIKRGAAIGITGGTASALGYGANQVSTQTTLGIERILDSLVNRYFGGAAGALTRTVRDVSYYSNQARGGTGGGLFGLSGTTLGVVGGAAALVGAGTALTGMAIEGGKLAVEITKLSEKTGLTTEEVIKLRSASTALDADFDRVTIGFKKFSSELTLASTADLPNASKSAKEAASLFKALGVNVKLAAQDPFTAIQQLAQTLAGLPDGFVKTNAASVLFGRGGMELIPVFDKLGPAMSATSKSSTDLANALGGKDGAADSQEKLNTQMVNFKNEADALEVSLAKGLLPALVATINWINEHTPQIKFGLSGGASTVIDLFQSLASKKGSGVSGPDFSVASDFLKSGDAAQKLKDVAAALAKVGDGSEAAAKAARKAAEEFKRSQEAFYKMLTESPTRKDSFEIQQRHDRVMDEILGGKRPPLSTAISGTDTGSLSTILGPISSTGALNGTLIPAAGPGAIDAAALLRQINDAHKEKFETQYEIDRQSYQDEQDQLNQALQKKLISQQEWKDASLKISQDWAKAQQELDREYIEKAGSLFDDLISGNTKKFSQSLLKEVEDIALKPFKTTFENYLGGIFSRLNGAVNGGGSAGGPGISTLGLGGIFGGVFGPNSPGGTPGWWRGNLGINGRTGTGGPSGGGQFGVATQTMYVTANVVNLSGPVSGGSGNGVGLPGASNFFGFGGSSFFGNNNPFSFAGGGGSGGGGFSGLGGLSSVLGKAAPFLASAVLLGSGIGSGNGASMSLGAAGLGTAISTALGNARKIPSSLSAQLGKGFGGAGLIGAGLSEGGVGGAISDIAGGIQLGSVIPGIGSLVGGILGGIAGVVRGIFGSKSYAQKVQDAMRNQAFNAPPSETFDFASNGSISSTLSTGFAQSGNSFSQFGLPSNTPFWANPIVGPLNKNQILQLQSEQAGLDSNQPFLGFPNTNPYVGQGPLGYKTGTSPNVTVNLNLPGMMDASMATAVFTTHAQTIAQLVGSQVRQSSSGFGRNVRSAVALP